MVVIWLAEVKPLPNLRSSEGQNVSKQMANQNVSAEVLQP